MYNALHSKIGGVVEDTYTQAEIDQMLAGYSPTGHTHPYSPDTHNHDAAYSAVGHKHDSRYYKEDEIDQMLAGYSPTGHTHPYTQLPAGVIMQWWQPSAPFGWVLCNGGILTTDCRLRNVLISAGFPFGQYQSDPLVPDINNRVIVGPGPKAIAATGGAETHVLTLAESPPHDHYDNDAKNRTVDSSQPYTAGDGIVWSATEFRVKASGPLTEGGGQPHNNMQPYIVLPSIIYLGEIF